MKKQKNDQRGITLIALVVTIIVLMIISGITVATLMGDNGIIKRAGDAKETQRAAAVEDEVKLAISENAMIDQLNSVNGGNESKKGKAEVVADLVEKGYLHGDEADLLETEDTITIGSITIDFSKLPGEEEEEGKDESSTIFAALKNVNYYDTERFWFCRTITISDTSEDKAMFYDEDYNGTSYIAYKGAIYKITYTGNISTREGTINKVEPTDIDISTLSVSDHNFNTIIPRNLTYDRTTERSGIMCCAYWDVAAELDYFYSSEGALVDIDDHFNNNW